MTLVGLDVGTSSCKAVLLEEDGKCLTTAAVDYTVRTTREGQFELDPSDVLSAALGCISSVTASAREKPRAVGIAAAGEAIAPISDAGEALDAVVLSADHRAFADFSDLVGPDEEGLFVRETALRPLPHYSVYKLLWWKKHRPQIYKRADCFVSLAGLVGARLGAPPVVDRSLAARIGAFAPAASTWSEPVLDVVGISRTKLPSIGQSGTAIGEITGPLAASLGLERGAQVALGGFDRACAAFAAGLVSPSDTALLDLGTIAAVLIVEADSAALALDAPVTPHVAPGLVTAIGGAQAGTSTFHWYRKLCATGADGTADAGSEVAALIARAAKRETSVLCLPHFAGSRFAFGDPFATAAFTGITLGTTADDIVRALADGIAYEIGLVVERLTACGASIERLVCTGGGSQSPAWQQTIADALELPIDSTSTRYATAIGAGLLAGVGVGSFADHTEAARHGTPPVKSYEPSPVRAERHRRRRAEFRALYEATHAQPDRGLSETQAPNAVP